MDLHRNARVAAEFAARARDYEANATLQRQVAKELAVFLPELERPDVLEVGCGTGFLTQRLVDAYPGARFLITDLAADMLAVCRERLARASRSDVRFALMDGEAPDLAARFDLIATAMTLQWFSDPAAGLARLKGALKPGGHLLFATLGPDCFPEWRSALAATGVAEGTVRMPRLDGVIHEEHLTFRYDTGHAFLQRLKSIGAALPRPGYQPLSPGALRAALRRLEQDSGGRVTWHVVYGHLRA